MSGQEDSVVGSASWQAVAAGSHHSPHDILGTHPAADADGSTPDPSTGNGSQDGRETIPGTTGDEWLPLLYLHAPILLLVTLFVAGPGLIGLYRGEGRPGDYVIPRPKRRTRVAGKRAG